MSTSPSIDAYDAQMLDFSDPDVPMNLPGSAEFFTETLMDHDGHLSGAAFGEHGSVEVDMEEYIAGDNAEYEMTDETAEYHRLHDELLDIEVYDASHAPSPLVPPQSLQPSVDVPINSGHPASASPSISRQATLPELQGEPETGMHTGSLDHSAASVPHIEPLVSKEVVSSELESVPLQLARSADASGESNRTSESHEQLGDAALPDGRPFEVPTADEVEPRVPPLTEERHSETEVAQHENLEPSTAESAPRASVEEVSDRVSAIQDEKVVDRAPVAEGVVDPLHLSDGVYIDPPPAVLLSVSGLSHPGYVLFNQHHVEGKLAGEPHDDRQTYSLLLEDRPTLYYEPLSSVFEALRQDEALLSRVPHSFEGELILDAYDLQLAVSEDNVHSRETSLHDLNILYDGSDLVGPLRLLLRATVPRFIIRFYALQEQIQRLNMAAAGEGEHEEEHLEQYSAGEEQIPQQGEVDSSKPVLAAPDGPEVPPASEAEESAKKPGHSSEPARDSLQESEPQGDTSDVQGFRAEYHEVTGEAKHALEDEGDYEGTNAGDEDELAKSESLDADRVRAPAGSDSDAAVAGTGQRSEFEGEQTEYVDYVQLEEYDERYGEDLLERAGGASPAQYGEPPHYEEEEEQDTSTAIDETLAVFVGLDEDGHEEDKSPATPVLARAILESESNEHTDGTINVPVLSKQDESTPNGGQLPASESTDEDLHEQVSGDQETEAVQAKNSLEGGDPDSKFVLMLEREADAEFDQTFNVEQSEHDGSIETAIQHDAKWDEWDDEDAEGEDEEGWIDPDAASNESSITLSSKASTKRCYDEVEPGEEAYVEDPNASPGSKRPRVE